MNDLIVDKLLKNNNWDQSHVFELPYNYALNYSVKLVPLFYNRHVTWDDNLDYLVGCSPLATAQIMKYNSYPDTPPMEGDISCVGLSFDIKVSGDTRQTTIIGGSKPNKGYNWELMPNNIKASDFKSLELDRPGNIVSDPNSHEYKVREEISSLMHDIGAILGSEYSYRNTAVYPNSQLFSYYFGYSSAVFGDFTKAWIPDVLKTNLDNAYPVIFVSGIITSDDINSNDIAAHSFVVDGYGYQEYGIDLDKVAYFHCNFGWGNFLMDSWVNLGDLPSRIDDTTSLDMHGNNMVRMVYNIISDDRGEGDEVHSGRLWMGNDPIQDTDVTVSYLHSENITNSKTNLKGVFGFKTLPNVALYDIRVGSSDYLQEGSLVNFIKREDFREINESVTNGLDQTDLLP